MQKPIGGKSLNIQFDVGCKWHDSEKSERILDLMLFLLDMLEKRKKWVSFDVMQWPLWKSAAWSYIRWTPQIKEIIYSPDTGRKIEALVA